MSDSPILQEPREVPEEYKTAMRDMAKWSASDRPAIPEHEFVTHILPILTTPSVDGKVDLTFWLSVAGTPLRAIDVVDNAGELLFTCPPLMRPLPTVAQEEMNYYQILSEATLHENVHPVQAQRYLDQHLSKARHGATLIDVDSAKQWNSIRQRYGLPLLTIGQEGQVTANGSSNPNAPVGDGSLVLEDDQEDF